MTWMQWFGLAVLVGRAILAAAGRHRASSDRVERGAPEAGPGERPQDCRGAGR